MLVEPSQVRDIDHLQEDDSESRPPRVVTYAFVVLAGGAIAFASMTMGNHRTSTDSKKFEALAQLVGRAPKAEKTPKLPPPELSTKDVTFPGILSDEDKPTTALAAVKSAPQPMASALRTGPVMATPGAMETPPPPPPTDRLPVVPLPAQHVLQASPIVTNPRDTLTKAASVSAGMAATIASPAVSGHEGGYQLQISSFRDYGEAMAFAEQLRARGHRAYVSDANVPGRGTWHRVRIGPFASQQAAASYRVAFEQKEHVVPFVVAPTRDGHPSSDSH